MARDLKKIFETPNTNVAKLLDKEEIAKIGIRAVRGYEADDESRAGWKKRNEEGMKLAMQLADDKSFPFENAPRILFFVPQRLGYALQRQVHGNGPSYFEGIRTVRV
jgi:hypothetical protein